MIDINKIEQIARQVCEIIPKNIRNFGHDLENKILQILKIQLTNMNFVNHDEFDIQIQLLSSLQEKILILEKRLLKLENEKFHDNENNFINR